MVVVAAGNGAAKRKFKKAPPGKVLVAGKGPPSLAVVSVDLATERVEVLVGGVNRAPEARLFTFHDDRDRHFIAVRAHCEAAEKSESPSVPQKIRCALVMPQPYLNANVRGLTVEIHGREVAASPEEVVARFAAAPRAPPVPGPPSLRSPGSIPPVAARDGGTAPDEEAQRDDWWRPARVLPDAATDQSIE